MKKEDTRYIDSWAKKVPYPGIEYCSTVLDKLEECYNLFRTKKYTIELSDDEKINLYIWSKNMCHLLGIDFKNISKENFDSYRKYILGLKEKYDSIDLVRGIIENKDKVLSYDEERNRSYALNFYRIDATCEAYKNLSNLTKFDFGCITPRTKNSGLNGKFQTEPYKFLYKKSDSEAFSHYILAMKKYNNKENDYFADTYLAYGKTKPFFDGQDITVPYLVQTDSNIYTASREQIIKLLKEYKDVVDEYNIKARMKISKEKLLILK